MKFLLVLKNFQTFIVTTPFAEARQLSDWLRGISRNNPISFVNDPIAWLPDKSFANMLITEEDVSDALDGLCELPSDSKLIGSTETWRDCHGTLMVDDNGSIFYSCQKSNSDWELPYNLYKGN
jgi:hypothetical protein